MVSLIDYVLQNTLTVREDVFGKNCTFIAFEEDAENYDWSSGLQSSARFGRILYRRDDQQPTYSDHLVLKVTPSTLHMKKYSMLAFFDEVFFYTRIQPLFASLNRGIEHFFPIYYNSLLQYNPNSDDAVIVFQNLQASGYSSPSNHAFLDYTHLSLMLRKLGQFHAYSYRARKEKHDDFHAFTLCMVETNGCILRQYGTIVPCIERSTAHVLNDPEYARARENILDMTDRCDEILRDVYRAGNERDPTHVLCHGDYLRNNVLFKYDENGQPIDLKMIDLANWRFASPAVDITLVLYLNADQKMRDEHWDDLIDEYYTAVRKTFPSIVVPSKEAILAGFGTAAVVAYFIASYFLPSLISLDYDDAPRQIDLMPEKYRDALFSELPEELLHELYSKEGGERATEALVDVLKDIIDRGFLPGK